MNAIILAAGMGTRLRPLTDDRPKALVEIDGESFFARQFRQLRGIDIDAITVVTGYMATAFDPWRGAEGLEFVHNEHYFDRNNLWSMYLVREKLADTLVLEGDVWLADGILPGSTPKNSCWFVGPKENMRNEWVVRIDSKERVYRIDVASGSGLILSGISYWNRADGIFLQELIAEAAVAPDTCELFWDDIPRRNLDRIDMRIRKLGATDWAEIDTLADKDALEAFLASPDTEGAWPEESQTREE
jgi:CTP:phosphocholine cytidylyltransferase-like protein